MIWDPLFEHVSGLVGAPPDQLKLIFSFLISYPLGSLYTRLPPNRPNVAHIFSLVVSAFILVPLLGLLGGTLQLLFACAGTYLIVAFVRSPRMPWIVFTFVMGHLMFIHIQRYINATPVTTIEISTSLMVMAMKLTTLAWNVHDGRRKAEVSNASSVLADVQDLDDSQLATRLLHVPSPLAFLGYCFFFPSVMVGPASDYTTYDLLVTHKLYATPPPGTGDSQAKAVRRRIPHGRKRIAALHLITGLIFLGIYATWGERAAYERILTPSWYTWSLVERFGFIQLAGIVARTKYYAVWSLTEGACILTGIGFNGYDPKTGRTLWNRVRNIDILSIETAESFKVLFDSWNCRTNVWLRDSVYKRLVPKGKKPGTAQSMATFVTSAFWHGVDPGYYLAFITAGFFTALGRQFRHFVRPYFLATSTSPHSVPNSLPKWPYPNFSKRVYDVLGWITVQINLNYIASAFLLLSFTDCIKAWSRMYWYGHILVGLTTIFFRSGGRKVLKAGLGEVKPPRRHLSAETNVPSFKFSPPSPIDHVPKEEKDPKDLTWIKHAFDNPSHQDSGKGVTPEAGFVDGLINGAGTPGNATPNSY